MRDLNAALREIGLWHLALALGLTVASLLCNASLDLVALRWSRKDLSAGKVLGTALIAGSFSMNAGGTLLGGSGIRLRFSMENAASAARMSRKSRASS